MNWIDQLQYLLQPENRWEWCDAALEQWCDENLEETNRMLRGEQ